MSQATELNENAINGWYDCREYQTTGAEVCAW